MLFLYLFTWVRLSFAAVLRYKVFKVCITFPHRCWTVPTIAPTFRPPSCTCAPPVGSGGLGSCSGTPAGPTPFSAPDSAGSARIPAKFQIMYLCCTEFCTSFTQYSVMSTTLSKSGCFCSCRKNTTLAFYAKRNVM